MIKCECSTLKHYITTHMGFATPSRTVEEKGSCSCSSKHAFCNGVDSHQSSNISTEDNLTNLILEFPFLHYFTFSTTSMIFVLQNCLWKSPSQLSNLNVFLSKIWITTTQHNTMFLTILPVWIHLLLYVLEAFSDIVWYT